MLLKVEGQVYRSIWLAADGVGGEIIDQTQLPFRFVVVRLETLAEAKAAISRMLVRGAPLIGATAAYGICLGLREGVSATSLEAMAAGLISCRPTAINLRWAVERMLRVLLPLPDELRLAAAYHEASQICEEDVVTNAAIGCHGAGLIEAIWRKKGGDGPVHILTHCNAGWLATVDWGTALAPVYKAVAAGIPVHVWVDETRPRNQGARLTAWELAQEGVPHTVIPDNAGGHLMQHGHVDLCIVGSDRTTSTGDVANKIGTYLKALAAFDNGVPFYVALPSSSIDFTMKDGVNEIPIEQRDSEEVSHIEGELEDGQIAKMRIINPLSPVANYGFDVTPARLVTALITERGICKANPADIQKLFPER